MSVLRTQLRGATRRPARLLLTGLAVLVASFMVFASVLTKQITERTLLNALSETPEAASLVVEGPVPAIALAAVRNVPGVADVVGRLADTVMLGESGEQSLSMYADPGSGALTTVRVVAGTFPDAPGEVAVTRRTAERMGLNPGTRMLITPENAPPCTVLVVGTVDKRDDSGAEAYTTDTLATTMLGTGFTRLEVRATAGTEIKVLSTAIGQAVRSGGKQPTIHPAASLRATEAGHRSRNVNKIFEMLAVFVVIAVIAAALVATSTFRIVFAQRMRQLALLRAIGASRSKIVGALAAEGALTGLVAGSVGVLAAFGLGYGTPLVLATFGISVDAPGVPMDVAAGVVLGAVVVSVLAVLAPAVSASRIAPLEALRTSATVSARRGIGWLRWVLGVLLLASAVALAALVYVAATEPLPPPSPSGPAAQDGSDMMVLLLWLVLSGAAAFGALIALGPVLLRPILGVLGWPIRRLGPVGQLAVGGVGGAPRRAAAVSAVVALGVTLIGGVLISSASLRALAEHELAAGVPADFELTAGGEGPLPDGLADRLKRRKELTHVAPYRRLDVTVARPTGPLSVRATDLDLGALPTTGKLQVATGSLGRAGPGGVVLADSLATSLAAGAGDRIRLTVGERTVDVTVVATLSGEAPLGMLLADRADFDRLGAHGHVGILMDAAAPGEPARDAARVAARTEAGEASGVELAVLADERDEFDMWFSGIVALAVGLLGLTVIIGVVGVGTTTALSVVERRQESGLLRAVGLSRAGVQTMLTTEAGLYGVIGAVIGLGLGVPYAWLAVLSLRIDVPFLLPVGQLATVLAVLAGLTALAGALPAHRAAKVSPAAAAASDG